MESVDTRVQQEALAELRALAAPHGPGRPTRSPKDAGRGRRREAPETPTGVSEARARAQELVREAEQRLSGVVSEAEARAGAIVAEAETRALEVVSEAEARAGAIVAEAETRALEVVSEAEARAQEVVTEAEARAQEVLDEAREQATTIVHDAETLAARVLDEAEKRAASIVRDAEAGARELVEEVERRLAALAGIGKGHGEGPGGGAAGAGGPHDHLAGGRRRGQETETATENTPEAAARALLASLVEACEHLDAEGRRHVLEVGAGVLRTDPAQVERLTLLASLREGTANVEVKANPVADVIRSGVDGAAHVLGGRRVSVSIIDHEVVLCDAVAVRVVLRELLTNAARWSDEDSVVRINARVHEGQVLVSVADDGKGVPPDDAEAVFQPFTWSAGAREHTLGIGLALVSELVAAQGGRVWVDGAAGVGSTFYFTLPPAPPAA